jgi:hypothetical protein
MGIGPVIIRNWYGYALGDMSGYMLYVLRTCQGASLAWTWRRACPGAGMGYRPCRHCYKACFTADETINKQGRPVYTVNQMITSVNASTSSKFFNGIQMQ